MGTEGIGGGNVPGYTSSTEGGAPPPPAPKTRQGDPETILGGDEAPEETSSKKDERNVRSSLFDFLESTSISNLSDQALEGFLLRVSTDFSTSQILLKKLYRKLFLVERDALHDLQVASADKTRDGAKKVFRYAVAGAAISGTIALGGAAWGYNSSRKANILSRDNAQLRRIEKDLSLDGVDQQKANALTDLQADLRTKNNFDFDTEFSPTGSTRNKLKEAGFTDQEVDALAVDLKKPKVTDDKGELDKNPTDEAKAKARDELLGKKADDYDAKKRVERRQARIEALEALGEAKETKSSKAIAEDLTPPEKGKKGSDLYETFKKGGYTDDEIRQHKKFFERSGESTKLFKESKKTGDKPWQETLGQFKKTDGKVSAEHNNKVALSKKEEELSSLQKEIDNPDLSDTDKVQKQKKFNEIQTEVDDLKYEGRRLERDKIVAVKDETSQINARQGFSSTQESRLSAIAQKDIFQSGLLNLASIGGQIGGIGEQVAKQHEYYEAQLLDASATQTQTDQQVKGDIIHTQDAQIGKAADLIHSAADLALAKNAFFTK